MPRSKDTRGYQQGGRLVLTDAESIDAAQVSGRWMATTAVVDLGVWR